MYFSFLVMCREIKKSVRKFRYDKSKKSSHIYATRFLLFIKIIDYCWRAKSRKRSGTTKVRNSGLGPDLDLRAKRGPE